MRFITDIKSYKTDETLDKKTIWQDEHTGIFFLVSSIRDRYADETMIFLCGNNYKVISYCDLYRGPSNVCHNTLMDVWNPNWRVVCALMNKDYNEQA